MATDYFKRYQISLLQSSNHITFLIFISRTYFYSDLRTKKAKNKTSTLCSQKSGGKKTLNCEVRVYEARNTGVVNMNQYSKI